MPRTHDLKVSVEFFDPLERGDKPFELRLNDRDYAVGDVLWLREWDGWGETYTGRECRRRITFVLAGAWLSPGIVALGLSPAWRPMVSYPKAPVWQEGPEVLLSLAMGGNRVCLGQQKLRTDDPDEGEPGFRSGEWDVLPVAWMPLPMPYQPVALDGGTEPDKPCLG